MRVDEKFWASVDYAALAKRFWLHVQRKSKTACWLWTGFANPYGSIQVNGRPCGSHRVAYALTHGAIPNGAFVLHECDDPRCVNPNHLFLGTSQANMEDMRLKGRSTKGRARRAGSYPVGERHYKARLTERSVRRIRAMAAQGVTQKTLAERFGVSCGAVCHIVAYRSWKHV